MMEAVRTSEMLVLIALMMEAARTSDTSVYFKQTTQHNIPEGCHLYTGSLPNDPIAWALPLACAAEMPPSSDEKNESRVAFYIPCIINT
jgi:hypothetical protein